MSSDASRKARHEFHKSPPGKAGFCISGRLLGGCPPSLDQLQKRLAAAAQAMAFLELVDASRPSPAAARTSTSSPPALAPGAGGKCGLSRLTTGARHAACDDSISCGSRERLRPETHVCLPEFLPMCALKPLDFVAFRLQISKVEFRKWCRPRCSLRPQAADSAGSALRPAPEGCSFRQT